MISRSSPTYEKPTSQRRLGSHHFLGMAVAGQQQGAVQEGHGTAVRELQGCHRGSGLQGLQGGQRSARFWGCMDFKYP